MTEKQQEQWRTRWKVTCILAYNTEIVLENGQMFSMTTTKRKCDTYSGDDEKLHDSVQNRGVTIILPSLVM